LILTLNLKQKMNDGAFVGGLVIGAYITLAVSLLAIAYTITPANTAYTKGITDCRSGKVSYAVTVGPEGVDTAYTYKP
jgi:hypothetical protein